MTYIVLSRRQTLLNSAALLTKSQQYIK